MLIIYAFVPASLPEYTVMAESLERCFNRAQLKHLPSEEGDTDEEFYISKEDKERKEKKRNRSSKNLGPESLIKATEEVQRKRSVQGGKGQRLLEDQVSKPVRPLTQSHWSFPSSQQHRHGDIRGMYHPAQRVYFHSSQYLIWHVYKVCHFNLFFIWPVTSSSWAADVHS